ncbi:hypothetical protein OsI_23004 [Oryza sativa Indica Group]|uniref:Uncharacterized protein n=1 Tax=Oryza sativa subsp. indica TaxID=39946 RepID=B8B2E4_ORYSI|nr:hypothetical protein OsI_23004 [Oryza sativa Indica Group]
MGTKGNQACVAIGSRGCVLRLWAMDWRLSHAAAGATASGDGRGLSRAWGRRPTASKGIARRTKAWRRRMARCWGLTVELAKRWADAGRGGIRRSSGDPDGDARSPRGGEKEAAVDGEEDVAAVAGGGAATWAGEEDGDGGGSQGGVETRAGEKAASAGRAEKATTLEGEEAPGRSTEAAR